MAALLAPDPREGTISGRTRWTGGEQGGTGSSARRHPRALADGLPDQRDRRAPRHLGYATVGVLARRARLPPRRAYNAPMPKPSIFPPEPRKGPQNVALTPEQIAKAVTDKPPARRASRTRPRSPCALVLPRAVLGLGAAERRPAHRQRSLAHVPTEQHHVCGGALAEYPHAGLAFEWSLCARPRGARRWVSRGRFLGPGPSGAAVGLAGWVGRAAQTGEVWGVPWPGGSHRDRALPLAS
jgi:hypothetical protein